MTDLPEEAVEAGVAAYARCDHDPPHSVEVHALVECILSAALKTGAIVTREQAKVAAADERHEWAMERAALLEALYDSEEAWVVLQRRVEELEAGLRRIEALFTLTHRHLDSTCGQCQARQIAHSLLDSSEKP